MKTAKILALAAVALCSAPLTLQAQDAISKKAKKILSDNCYRCHGQDGSIEGGFNFVLDQKQLLAKKKVVAGDADESLLIQRIKSGEMPPEGEEPRPSEEDLETLRQWIEGGAADFNPAQAARQFISNEDILAVIRNDLDSLKDRNRPFTRYFTITHLYNAGLSKDELSTYRVALSKLVNSLSWGRRVSVPQPIDKEKTIFRIDLRDYRWNEHVWDQITAANPYGVAFTTDDALTSYSSTGTRVPFVRADWFVAAASRPPLYHDVLQLPTTDIELEKLLQVNVAENLRTERMARAGFNGSGVSRNNRLIERHDSPYGAYWKSYDFGGNSGVKNLFAHPLGPGGDTGFVHDGGELIYNLPNGLQAYMLVDEKGNRIDKGPTSIVSDPKQADRAIVNGLSCMSCHSRGMIVKNDQIRSHVLRSTNAFQADERETILALYPEKDAFAKLLKEDADRFQRAVELSGAQLGTTEPIVTLALRFEAELDLPLAAAEAGMTSDQFSAGLDSSPDLARALGVLTVEGGTVQRQAFVDSFASIVLQMQLGEFLTPGTVVAGEEQEGKLLVAPDGTSTGDTAGDTDVQFQNVKAALDRLGLIYEETQTGNFKLLFDMQNGRTQVAIIQTATRDFRSLRIRDIWSPALKSEEPLSQDVATRLLMDSEDQKLGAWEIIDDQAGPDMVVFTVKIPADASPELIHNALLTAVNRADPMEAELTNGNDEF